MAFICMPKILFTFVNSTLIHKMSSECLIYSHERGFDFINKNLKGRNEMGGINVSLLPHPNSYFHLGHLLEQLKICD